jgi:hypothetical protein
MRGWFERQPGRSDALGRVHLATIVAILLVVGGHWATYPVKDSVWWNSHAPALARFHTTALTSPDEP